MRPFAPASIAIAVALPLVSLASAQADEPKWSMMKDSSQVSLVYGDGSEESDLVLSCKPRSNSVRFFIGETDPSLKPNMKVTVSVTAGSAKATVAGKTVPNELAGVPSFIGDLTAADPLFDAIAGAPTVRLKIAKTAKDIPLKTLGGKAVAFSKACRKS